MASDAGNSVPGVEDDISLTISHHGKREVFTFPDNATIADLAAHMEEVLQIPTTNQKLLVSPKPGLLKSPFSNDILLSTIATRKITLLGSTTAEISALNAQVNTAKTQLDRRRGPVKAATPARNRDWKTLHDRTTYTFLQIKPLPYLPNPERSTAFLERLRDDPGIRASMAKHKFTVPLLTEMNPAEHTTHESRTLGLNRNAGEVIELRLRTDAYDGYRDYRTIRKTLCHELAHNVHGPHDRNFWELCKQIEREVDAADWKSGGRSVGDEEVYVPDEEDVVADHGGWTGGEFVLGTNAAAPAGSSGDATQAQPMSRRDILAKAAEERMKRDREQRDSHGNGS
ncbi:hypothetical protein FH972_022516 [Carpinus fangiana]|uniref:WLM domain-containing protein n=1 Tax=Carpinus fangiana TaxID=176857 RepID=A0A5N6KSV7_9ROSI|nr:hypothetical protein FH972_022516 [Carpinus fangiana]